MIARRHFLLLSSGTATLASLSGCTSGMHHGTKPGMPIASRPATAAVPTKDAPVALPTPESATAITQVPGEGIKLTGVALRYAQPVSRAQLAASGGAAQFAVAGRRITDAYVSQSATGVPAPAGDFVVLQLDTTDSAASLLVGHKPARTQAEGTASPSPGPGPSKGLGKAGDVRDNAPATPSPQASVTANGSTLQTQGVINLVLDDFRQFEFADAQTGKTLRYNLFVPRPLQPGRRYPLVLFMHDAGPTGKNTRATLLQGNGAIAWATPEAQAKNPCFVLAPQFDEIVADDDSHTSSYLQATLNLIRALEQRHPIDPQRRYATGQSGGGMLAIAMNVQEPTFFAASYLVACQWDATVVAPMAHNKLWITVSQDDAKAWPGQTAIVQTLARHGAKVAQAVWNAQWTPSQFQTAFDAMDAQQANVNLVAFEKGSVFTPGESASGGAGHVNTWRYAYSIAPVREWLFRQRAVAN